MIAPICKSNFLKKTPKYSIEKVFYSLISKVIPCIPQQWLINKL